MSNFLSIPAEEIENVPEPQAVDTAEEVLLRTSDTRFGTDKNSNDYVIVRFVFVAEADAKSFTKFFGIPGENMDLEQRNKCIRNLKYFYEAFEIDYSSGQVDMEQLIGAEGWALVGVDPKPDSEYGPENFIRRFIAPA